MDLQDALVLFELLLFGILAASWLLTKRSSLAALSRRPETPPAPPPAVAEKAEGLTLPPLSDAEEVRVRRGEVVFRPYRNDQGINRGVAVQRVKAPVSTVWKCILDFDAYPRMVGDVCDVDVYERRGGSDKVAVSVGYSFVRLTTFLEHTYSPELSQLTWKLDAKKPAAFKFNEGFWIVRPDPLDAACSIVYYSIAVELKGWVPPFVNSYVAKTGLPRAVAWVQKEAEARAAAATPPTTQLSPPSKTKIVRDACWAKLAAECQCRDEIPRGPFACLLGPLAACLPPPPRA